MLSVCMEDRPLNMVNNDRPVRRRRSLPSIQQPPTSLLETLVTSAVDFYDRLVRLAFPVAFTRSSQVYEWENDRTPKMAEITTDEHGKWCHSRDCLDETTTECSSDAWGEMSDTSEFEYLNGDEIETRAQRVLSVASYCPDDKVLIVQQYLCPCGKCTQYNVIAQDVARLVTWRDAAGITSITRLLQAFSTYNEAIGYHPDMIETADECLSTWSGDEDQAFTSFVMLQDVVPFLCANAV